ncbi:MAG: hypothetical protein O7D30_04210 [Rickettsia endosymbiont of Ixodes persulcatus]|nr:hypothetical protein [Rickettsia endosymbiont of Ixodes persulcatus]
MIKKDSLRFGGLAPPCAHQTNLINDIRVTDITMNKRFTSGIHHGRQLILNYIEKTKKNVHAPFLRLSR